MADDVVNLKFRHDPVYDSNGDEGFLSGNFNINYTMNKVTGSLTFKETSGFTEHYAANSLLSDGGLPGQENYNITGNATQGGGGSQADNFQIIWPANILNSDGTPTGLNQLPSDVSLSVSANGAAFSEVVGPVISTQISVVPYADASLFESPVENFNSAQGEVYALDEGVLGRAPKPLEFERLAARLQGGESLDSAVQGLLSSAEFTADFGSYTNLSNTQFIGDLYETALHRQPDAGGLHSYENALANGTSRQQVALDIVLSQEAEADLSPLLTEGVYAPNSSDSQIARLYYGLLDRTPDAFSLTSWEAGVASGLSLTAVAQDFLNSAEYKALYGIPSNSQFLTELYQDALGRAPDAAGFQSWSDALSSGESRVSVALGIVESSEAEQHLAPKIEVGMKVT